MVINLARKRMHQPVEHQMRNVARVPAILELPQIFRKALLAYADLRSVDAAPSTAAEDRSASPNPLVTYSGHYPLDACKAN